MGTQAFIGTKSIKKLIKVSIVEILETCIVHAQLQEYEIKIATMITKFSINTNRKQLFNIYAKHFDC